MKSNSITPAMISLALLTGVTSASAHVTYSSGRDFGTLSPGNQSTTLSNTTTISSTYGWAYATDSNFGDSHRTRAYRFTLANAGNVTISVAASGTGLGILLPAFSVYSGLAHISPVDAGRDHDDSGITQAYLAGLFGAPGVAQGAFNALGDWKIGASASVPDGFGNYNYSELSTFVYQGNAADGTSSNFGSASGINGDGSADGFVTGTFYLPAGDYSFFVGGAQYLAVPDPGIIPTYGAQVSISVVPEPSGILLGGLSVLGIALRRRRAGTPV